MFSWSAAATKSETAPTRASVPLTHSEHDPLPGWAGSPYPLGKGGTNRGVAVVTAFTVLISGRLTGTQ